MMRPFISSDGSGRTAIADCELVASARRCTAVVTILRARASAVRRACASARRTCAAASFSACVVIRRDSSARASSALNPATDSSSARAARSASAILRSTSRCVSSREPRGIAQLLGGQVDARAYGALEPVDVRAVRVQGLLTLDAPAVATLGVGEQRPGLVLDRRDVLGRACALDPCLAAGDQDQDECHETGSEQSDDGRQGTWVIHWVILWSSSAPPHLRRARHPLSRRRRPHSTDRHPGGTARFRTMRAARAPFAQPRCRATRCARDVSSEGPSTVQVVRRRIDSCKLLADQSRHQTRRIPLAAERRERAPRTGLGIQRRGRRELASDERPGRALLVVAVHLLERGGCQLVVDPLPPQLDGDRPP